MITVKTKLVGLLGYPLEHSFSPEMQNQNFKEAGLDYYYFPIEVKNNQLEDVVKGIRHMNFGGFNVTKPNKIEILKYLDEIDPIAKVIGSVNTVKVENGKLIGYNTDGEGFVRSMEIEKKVDATKNRFLILGAGGAARAIVTTLASRKAKNILIANRTYSTACDLANEINEKVYKCCDSIALNSEELKEKAKNVDVIINTTSMGMYPDVDSCAISEDVLHKDLLVGDIVYNPLKTKLLKMAENKGCDILIGIGMLVNQGAYAFEIWTGEKAPVERMSNIVKEIINRKNEK